MHFARPELGYLFWIIPALMVFYIRSFRQKKKIKARFGNLELLGKLAGSASETKQRWKAIILVAGIFLLIFTLMQPQYGAKMKLVNREGQDIIIALDVSTSMLAEDLPPNRLDRAKRAISGMIDLMRGDRVGLVVFAGKSFVECPLTLDYSACKMFLDIITPDIIPVPGTAIGDAIASAREAFVQMERKHKVLILLTDGEDFQSDPLEAAKEAAKEGIRIYTIGVGNPEGVPIPLRDSYGNVIGHKRDRSGEVVITKLDEVTLEKIALLTDGKYYRSSLGEDELRKIYNDIDTMEKKKIKAHEYSQYEDRFQIFLAGALLLIGAEAIISDRKRNKKSITGKKVI
jgi:Ca-activated chloride channel homolog